MLNGLWLIPTLPFAGFLVLAIAGARLQHRAVASIGVGSVGLSAVLALLIGADYAMHPPAGDAFAQPLWTWMTLGGFSPSISLYLDALSVVMILVVTVVSFLILLYSSDTWVRKMDTAAFSPG